MTTTPRAIIEFPDRVIPPERVRELVEQLDQHWDDKDRIIALAGARIRYLNEDGVITPSDTTVHVEPSPVNVTVRLSGWAFGAGVLIGLIGGLALQVIP